MSLKREVSGIAHSYYVQQQRTARRTANNVQRIWQRIDKTNDFWTRWYEQLPNITDEITKGQYENTVRSALYLKAVSDIQGVDVPDELNPTAYLTPTEDLWDFTGAAPAAFINTMQHGGYQQAADLRGLSVLTRTVGTFVQDAGRAATGVYTAATPDLHGYYRQLSLPACDRCAVLAGKWFRDNADFERHPNCDCISVPAAERDSSMEFDGEEALRNGQIRGLSEADRKAVLEEGADLNQVVNAKRGGLQHSEVFGKTLTTTTEGTTKRSVAGVRLIKIHGAEKAGGRYMVAKTPRLRPTEIYKQAHSNDEVRKLLYRNGYIL